MILKLLFNTRVIWMIHMKILMNAILIKHEILIVFDDMIADTLTNKKFQPIVTELFIRGRKLDISLVFTTISDLLVPKIIDQILYTI